MGWPCGHWAPEDLGWLPTGATLTLRNRNPVATGDAALCPTKAGRRAANPAGTPESTLSSS